MWKKIRHIGLILLFVGLLTGVYLLYSNIDQDKNAKASFENLETETVQAGALEITISAVGKVRSAQSTVLSWETSGIVETVNRYQGESVQTGDVLAELKQTSLPQDVILAQASLEEYLNALEELSNNAKNAKTKAVSEISIYTNAVRDAQYQLDNFTVPSNQADMGTQEALTKMWRNLDAARQAFEPYKYYPSGDETRKERKEALDEAQADYNSAVKRLQYETDLEVAQANLQKALQDYEKWKSGPTQGEISAAEAKVASAQATLSKAWIEAPFEGTITEANPQPGDQVSPNQLAFTINNLSKLFVDLEVSEVDINHIEIGQPVKITFDAIRNKEYHGEVIELASTGSDSSGVVNFSVTIQIMDPDEDISPGMTAEVEIVIQETEETILIPNQAIRTNLDGNLIVYTLDTNRQMKEIEIELGESSDTYSQITNGILQIGDKVVLNPPDEDQEAPQFIGPMRSGEEQGNSIPNPYEDGGN
jgi:HlyD family secretion protein